MTTPYVAPGLSMRTWRPGSAPRRRHRSRGRDSTVTSGRIFSHRTRRDPFRRRTPAFDGPRPRHPGSREMRQVRAGYDQGAPALQYPAQRPSEARAHFRIGPADHDRHNPGGRKQVLDEGDLDFDRVFLRLCGRVRRAFRSSASRAPATASSTIASPSGVR